MDALLTRRGGSGSFAQALPQEYPEKKDSTNTSITTLPRELYCGCSVVYRNNLYILGGYDQPNMYRLDDGTWTLIPNFPWTGFIRGNAVVYEDAIHILGSEDPSANNRTHYRWTEEDGWESVSTIPVTAYDMVGCVYQDKIHLMGHFGNTSNYHYTWDGTVWTKLSDMPQHTGQTQAVVYRGNMHLLGGLRYTNSDNATKHHFYNGSTWTKDADMPYEFYQGGAVVYADKIHILGRGTNTAYGKYHYEFDGTVWKQLPDISGGAYGTYGFGFGNAVVYHRAIQLLGGNNNTSCRKLHYSVYSEILSSYFRLPKGAEVYTKGDVEQKKFWYTDTVTTKINTQTKPIGDNYVYGDCMTKDDLVHFFIPSNVGTSAGVKHYTFDGTETVFVDTSPGGRATSVASCLIHNDKIHLLHFGGDSEDYHFEYDNGVYTKLNTLPFPYTDVSTRTAVEHRGEIHLLGGYGNSSSGNYGDENGRYHYKWVDGDTWVKLNPLPEGTIAYRRNSGFHSMDGVLYFLNCHENYLPGLYRYLDDTDSWELITSNLPPYMVTDQIIDYKGELYFGSTNQGTTLTDRNIYKWNKKLGVFDKIRNLTYFSGSKLAVLHDYIYVLYGEESDEHSNYYYAYKVYYASDEFDFPVDNQPPNCKVTEISTPVLAADDKHIIPAEGIYELVQYAGEKAMLILNANSILAQQFGDNWYSYYKKGMTVNGQAVTEEGWQRPVTDAKVLMIGKGWSA